MSARESTDAAVFIRLSDRVVQMARDSAETAAERIAVERLHRSGWLTRFATTFGVAMLELAEQERQAGGDA